MKGPKIWKVGHVTQATLTYGSFYGPYDYDCTKFEADSCIRSNVMRGFQNFEIGSRDPDHAHLRAVYGPVTNDDSDLVLCTVWCGLRMQVVFVRVFDSAPRSNSSGRCTIIFIITYAIVLLRNRPTVRPYRAQAITLHISRSPGLVQRHRSYITREQGHGMRVAAAEVE